MAHQRVQVNEIKGTDCQVFLEVGPHCPEQGFHIHHLIIEAMLSFVIVQWQQL